MASTQTSSKAKAATNSEIQRLEQAQEKSSTEISQRLVEVERLVSNQASRNDRQEDKNQAILYVVVFAAFLILVTVAAEVILSTSHEDSDIQGYYEQVEAAQSDVASLKEQLDLLKANNPYLK
jgi:negative regulator of genetic competence, sporulation and motility